MCSAQRWDAQAVPHVDSHVGDLQSSVCVLWLTAALPTGLPSVSHCRQRSRCMSDGTGRVERRAESLRQCEPSALCVCPAFFRKISVFMGLTFIFKKERKVCFVISLAFRTVWWNSVAAPHRQHVVEDSEGAGEEQWGGLQGNVGPAEIPDPSGWWVA